jgi:probable HAF family extracellular repeat protein
MCAHPVGCAVSIAVLFVAAQVHVVGQAQAAQYNVVDLGYLPNSDPNAAGSEGLGIDNAGEAAASSDIGPFTTHGMYWNGTSASDLDAPSSTVNTFVHGMGPSGKIVGENGAGLAFVWNHGTGFSYLTNLGGTTGAAFGTNAAGDVVGTNTQSSLVYGVAWKLAAGAPTQLTPADSKFFASARAINSSRTIAGISFDSNDLATVWNYNSGSGAWTAQSLGTLGGVGSDAFDINSAGNVVGFATRSTEVGGTGAFLWHPGDASVTDLDPSQDFGNTFASGINDNNVVVGSDTNGGAFVWDSAHGMRNLQDLIDPSAPYLVTDARDVNDNGWIIGTATNTNDNLPHAIIFKPISQILPGDYNRDQHVNAADIAALELALTNLANYKSLYGVSDAELLQINLLPGESTAALNNSDLQALLTYLKTGDSANPIPEPASACLAVLAAIGCAVAWRKGGPRKTLECANGPFGNSRPS